MRSLLFSAALFLLGSLSACSTVSVSSDYDTSVNFSTFKTWSWFPEGGVPGSIDQGITSLSSSRIREALEGGLIARGYPKVTSEPSFLVSFHTVVQQRLEAGTAPYGYGWRTGYAGAAPAMVYDEGTLLVDFIDPKSKTMIWRGVASAVVDPTNSVEKRENLIREAVTKILDKFPPKTK
jgi:hypothetical protein